MTQMILKLNNYVDSNVKVVSQLGATVNGRNLNKIIFRLFSVSFLMLVFLYVSFLSNIIFNITERRSLENNINILSSEIGNLNLTYLSASSQLDLKLGISMGLTEIKPKFINSSKFVASSWDFGKLKLATSLKASH